MKGCNAAPGDSFAVQELFVAGGRLDGVAEGMAEVEDHAEVGLFFIFVDDVGLDLDAVGDDAGEDGGVAGFGGVLMLFEVGEEFGRADDAGFDGFVEAGDEFGFGKRGEEVDVGEDGARVVKGADEVFAGGEVDAGFAADGGVDLGEEGGGDLDVGDAAHVDGGEEAGDVADDAASEGEQEGVAVGAVLGELLGEGFDGGEAFVFFAGGVEEDGGGLRFGERGADFFAPERPDVGAGDEEGAVGIAAHDFLEARVEGAEEVLADGDVVLGGGGVEADGFRHGLIIVGARPWLFLYEQQQVRPRARRAPLRGVLDRFAVLVRRRI